MCNSWNHPANCRCGFGGPGHLGGWARPIGLSGRSSRRITYDSYINPNARCPRCGVPVYFYQSESGGRVFFDELGPPWPKHPCTSDIFPSLVLPLEGPRPTYSWESAGWSPLLQFNVASITPTLLRLSGYIADELLTLYLPKGSLPQTFEKDLGKTSLCHIRRTHAGVFEVSWLLRSLSIVSVAAYISNIDAETAAERIRSSRSSQGPSGRATRAKT